MTNTGTAENNVTELNFIQSDVHIPRMVPILTLAEETGFSYKSLYLMCKENKIVYIKSGNKYYINVDKFVEYLNKGEQEEQQHDIDENRPKRRGPGRPRKNERPQFDTALYGCN